MAERIVKSEMARKGEAVEVQTRHNPTHVDTEHDLSADDAEQGLSPAEREQATQAQAAATEASQILMDAEQARDKLMSEATGEIERLKTEFEEQQAQQRAQFEDEMQTRRDQLEKEVRAKIEETYRERYEAAARLLESLAAETRSRQSDFLASSENTAFELVLEIAKSVIRRDLRDSRQAITGLIASAFEMLKPEQILTVHVNPGIFHLLLEDALFKRGINEAGIKLDSIDLEIDENLRPDQFVAEVATGRIVFDLEQVLEEMVATLKERRDSAEELPEDVGDDE